MELLVRAADDSIFIPEHVENGEDGEEYCVES